MHCMTAVSLEMSDEPKSYSPQIGSNLTYLNKEDKRDYYSQINFSFSCCHLIIWKIPLDYQDIKYTQGMTDMTGKSFSYQMEVIRKNNK